MVKLADNGWTTVQEANADKHILEVGCRAENGMVVKYVFVTTTAKKL